MQCRARLNRLGRIARNGKMCGLQSAAGNRTISLGPRQGAVGLGDAGIRSAPGLSRHLIGPRKVCQTVLQRLVRLAGTLGGGGDFFKVAL